MNLGSVTRYLEGEVIDEGGKDKESQVAKLPSRFIERFVLKGIKVDLIEPGRIVCSMKVQPHLLNAGKFLHGGAMATVVDLIGTAAIYTNVDSDQSEGVSVEINVSYLDAAFLDEEIEIESRALRVGKAVAVASVELRRKKNGKMIAQGRHTKILMSVEEDMTIMAMVEEMTTVVAGTNDKGTPDELNGGCKPLNLTHLLLASLGGLLVAAAAFAGESFLHRRKAHQGDSMGNKDQKIAPLIERKDSGRRSNLERFSHYVARQLGFEDPNECPQLCKLANAYLVKTKGYDENVYEYLVNEAEPESLYVHLLEELERCILTYFAFNWTQSSNLISQKQPTTTSKPRLVVDSFITFIVPSGNPSVSATRHYGSTFIQRTIHASRLSTFRRRLSEGSVISLVDLRSHRATLIFHSLTPQSPFVSTMESFAETTDSKKDIPTELFRLRSHEHLLAVANTKKKVKTKAVANTKKKVKTKKLRKIRIGWTVVGSQDTNNNGGGGGLRNKQPCFGDYSHFGGTEDFKRDLEDCQKLVLDPSCNIDLDTPSEFHLSQLVNLYIDPFLLFKNFLLVKADVEKNKIEAIEAQKVEEILFSKLKQRFERVTKDLKVTRVFSTLVEEMKVINVGSSGESHCTEVMSPVAHNKRSPVLLLMGGGMGAGKSTVLKDILHEPFWSEAGDDAVLIEADAFKETDVIYRALSSRGHHDDMLQTAELVHQSSTDAASSLLVTALNEGRDVIMDGTLSWEPFVEQMITMARNVHKHRYRMGAGYKVNEDGTTTEEYWRKEETEPNGKQQNLKPYRIELVGVVCDAYLAVARGIRRALMVKRAVRVKSQLKSHKSFANAFPKYCELVDNARLYCTNAVGGPPRLIAWKAGNSRLLVDPEDIECLKRVSNLNPDAESIYELYSDPSLLSQPGSVWTEIVIVPSRPEADVEPEVAAAGVPKKRTFKKFAFKGVDLDALLDMSTDDLVKLFPSRIRRRFSRGLTRKPMALIKKLRKAKREAPQGEKPEPVRTHLRNMIIVPEMIGSIIGVYNGKTFNQVEIKPEMIGHYLAEFSISYKPVKHGRPGVGATHSSRFIPLK
ncbi:hypothetical protein Bca101_090437 [Brassica carinata]